MLGMRRKGLSEGSRSVGRAQGTTDGGAYPQEWDGSGMGVDQQQSAQAGRMETAFLEDRERLKGNFSSVKEDNLPMLLVIRMK